MSTLTTSSGNLSNAGGPTDHIQQFENNLQASLDKARIGHTEPVTEDSEAEMLATTNPGEMVAQVEKRIALVAQQMTETRGTFDKHTGQAIPVIPLDSPRRRALEVEYHSLTAHTLPLTRQMAAGIAAKQAALPSQESKMREEADRQQRIHAAAIKLVEQREVEALADRMRKGAR